MRGLVAALAAAAVLFAHPVSAADSGLRPIDGPGRSSSTDPGVSDGQAEFRFAFYAVGDRELYLKNTPAAFHAAFRPGWETHVFFVGPAGETDKGILTTGTPMELGHVQAMTPYGLRFLVTAPAADLASETQWNFTYTLAVHSDAVAGVDNGASLDESFAVQFQLTVQAGAVEVALATPWQLPPLSVATGGPDPSENTSGTTGTGFSVDWRIVGAAAGILVIVLLLKRRSKAQANASSSAPNMPAAPSAVAPVSAAPVPPAVAPAPAATLDSTPVLPVALPPAAAPDLAPLGAPAASEAPSISPPDGKRPPNALSDTSAV